MKTCFEDNHCQLFYIAGLFDGEGSAGVYKPCQLLASIQMTSDKALLFVKEYFGGHIEEVPARRLKEHDSYRIAYSALTAENFLKAILPHLIVRKEQVGLVLDTWERLKWAPRWVRQNIIKEYRVQLLLIAPAGARGGGKRGKDRVKRRRRKRVAVNQDVFSYGF